MNFFMSLRGKVWQLVLFGLFLAISGILRAKPIILSISDLGRHITYGHLVLAGQGIPRVNLFSYIHPDFPFVGHHWGAGVIFALLDQTIGFTGLSLFAVFLSLLTIGLLFLFAWRRSSFFAALLTGILVSPLFVTRFEVRPEQFSYFFLIISILILWEYVHEELHWKYLLLLPFIQLLWVNIHIYFFLGFFVFVCFLFDACFKQHSLHAALQSSRVRILFWIGISMALLSLCNPWGVTGLLYPLFIFQNYGYEIGENLPLWLVQEKTPFFFASYIYLIIAGLLLSWVVNVIVNKHQKDQVSIALILLSAFAIFMIFFAIRNTFQLSLLAFFIIPLLLRNAWSVSVFDMPKYVISSCALLCVFLFFMVPNFWFTAFSSAGIGLAKGSLDGLKFIQERSVSGPIFNSSDVGGYLIYGMYPEQQVFVDNRPEAYPASFFANALVPALESEAAWNVLLEEYNFQSIVWSMLDLSSRGRQFLERRAQDPLWKVVFKDSYLVILERTSI